MLLEFVAVLMCGARQGRTFRNAFYPRLVCELKTATWVRGYRVIQDLLYLANFPRPGVMDNRRAGFMRLGDLS